MRVLFTTDLHGSVWKYERLADRAVSEKAAVVINGGDMLPKHGDLFKQGEFISGCLAGHFARLDEAGIHYLCYLGNDDLRIFDDSLEQVCGQFSRAKSFAQSKVEINGYEFIGMNWVVDYPFRLKDRCRIDTPDYVFQRQLGTGLLSTPKGWQELPDWMEHARLLPTIASELESLVRPHNPDKAVYAIHMPPANLGLDVCGNYDAVGSKALCHFLEKTQPLLTLHGHIHESPEMSGKWFGHIGRTVCIQPGQMAEFTYVTIDLDSMTFERKTEAR